GYARRKLELQSFKQDFARERISIGVQSVRRESENHIANSYLAAIDDLDAIDHADDATCEIVLPALIHSGHLRGLTADERATSRATGFGKSTQQLRENARLQFFRADIVEKKKRSRAEDGDVVDTVIHKIGTDGVVFVRGEGDLQLGADAVDARDQHRLTHRAEIRGEQATEPSDFSQHL